MKDIIKKLKKAKNIALFAHVSPDPDTIGSTLAFCKILESLNKKVDLFCDETNDKYCLFEDYSRFSTDGETDLEKYNLLVAVDVSESFRLGVFEEKFLAHENTVRVDHHTAGANFAKTNLCKPYSACAILIYEIAKKLKVKISAEIATMLYFAICGDTGLFKNNNTDSVTFRICAELFECGADFKKVYGEFYSKTTLEYIKLSSSILLGAKTNDEYGFAILSASQKDYEKFNPEQNENVSNLPHSYLNCGYKIAVILKEKEDGVHCSFRSKFEYDCNQIAAVFGGGGHKNASGCIIEGTLKETEKQVEKEIIKYLKSLV